MALVKVLALILFATCVIKFANSALVYNHLKLSFSKTIQTFRNDSCVRKIDLDASHCFLQKLPDIDLVYIFGTYQCCLNWVGIDCYLAAASVSQ